MPQRRRILGPGSSTSYKVPVIKGEKGKDFYRWLNSCVSINKLITEALKLKYMMDKMTEEPIEKRGITGAKKDTVERDNQQKETFINISDVDVLSESGDGITTCQCEGMHVQLKSLRRMLDSVKR